MEIEIKEQSEHTYMGIRKKIPVAQIAEVSRPLYEQVYNYVMQSGGQINGPALAIYHSEPSAEFDMECAVPVANELPASGDIKAGTLPAGKVAIGTHRGSYEGLKQAWEDYAREVMARGIELQMPCWEEYAVSMDSESDPSKFVTLIVGPLK